MNEARVYRPMSRRMRVLALIIAAICVADIDLNGSCGCDWTPRVSAIVQTGHVAR